MSNYEDVIAVREEFATGVHFGSAQRENDAYLDSITGKLNTLKQTWISILNTFANSESIKGALDVLISVSEAIDSVVKSLDKAGILLPVTFSAFSSGATLLKNLAGFGQSSYQIRQVGDSLQLVNTQASASTGVFKNIFKSFKEGQGVSQKLSGSFKAIGTSIKSSVLPNLTAMFTAGIKGAVVAGVFTAIGWAIDKTVNKYKNLDKELQSNAEATKAQLDSLNSQKSSLKSMAKEYDTLSNKVDKTEEEVLRFIELKHQIAEIAPELVIGVDSDNNPILNLNGSLEEYIGNLDQAINRQKTLFANDSMDVGKNALDSLKSSLNKYLIPLYSTDELELGKQNDKIITARQDLINKLNEINKENNFKDFDAELEKFAKQNDKYNEDIINSHQKVKEAHAKIVEETSKAQSGMNAKLMDTSAMKKASDETKKLGAQMISAFDLSEVDSNRIDQMVYNMSKNLTSGEFDTSLQKVAELRAELEKTYNFNEYEAEIEKFIPEVAKFLGVSEDMARSMLKVPEVMKSSEDALDEFLRSMGKTKQYLNFDEEAQRLADQFYAVNDALYQLADTSNLVTLNNKIQLDPEIVLNTLDNKSIPEQIRNLLGEFNTDGVVDVGEVELLLDVMTAFKLGNTQQSHQILADVQKQLDEIFGEGKINIKDLKFDVNGEVENVNVDTKKLEETLKVFGDREEVKKVFTTEVVGLDKVEFFAEIIKKLPTNKEYTNKFIADNAQALANLETYQDVIDWIVKHPEVISKYKINVEGNEKLEKAKKDFEAQNGKESASTAKIKVEEEGVEETKKKLEETKEKADELSQDINLSVNDGELQGSVESFNKLIEYSTKLKDGEYKLSFTSDTGESINQINKLKDTVNDLSGAFSSLPSITVRIATETASKNVTGLRNNIEKFNSLSGGLKTLVFSTDTTRASKNVTGLKNNVADYKSKYGGKTITTTFSTDTARASKNVTGLKNNIADYKTEYGGKTITTTFKVVTKKITQTSTVTSNKNNKGEPASIVSSTPQVANTLEGVTANVSQYSRGVQAIGDATVASVNATANAIATSSKTISSSPALTLPTPLAITGGDIHNSMKYDINLLKELEARITKVANQLSLLDKKAEDALGMEKIKYLQQQNSYYAENLKLLAEQEDAFTRQKNYYQYFLSNKGFTFNVEGNMTNYEEKLLAMEKEKERLDEIAEAKEKAYNSYTGDNEKTKNSLNSAYETAKDNADKYGKSLEEIKKYAEEYYKVTFESLPELKEQWEEYRDAIKENTYEIKRLEREQANYTKNTKLKELSMLQDEINDKQDILISKMEHATGEEKSKYQKEYLELLEKEAELQQETINQYKDSLQVYQKQLDEFGFSFDANGTITNLSQVLNGLQGYEDLEHINELLEEYFAIQRDELPNAQKEWFSLKNEIDSTQNEIDEATESVKKFKKEIANLHIDSGYKDHERDLAEVESKLALAQIGYENSTGQNKIEYLEQVIKLTRELKNENEDLLEYEKSVRNSLMKELGEYGFNFRDDGSIVGYGGKIAQLKESLSEDEFEEVFGKIEEYLNITYEKIPDIEQNLEELGYTVEDYNDELESLIRQRALDFHLNKIKEIENEYDKLADKLNIIDIKLRHAWGQEKLDLLDEQIKLLEEQMNQQYLLMKKYQSMTQTYQVDLKKYGVEFDSNGDITNINQILNKYQDHRDIEKLKGLIDEYLEIQRETLPDVQKEWESLNATIKDAYKEQLEVTKEIEDKILQVYKKQLEERKKLIDEELDARLEALKKEKDAYNKYRDEAEYKDKYEDQLAVVKDLEKKIEIAKKDTSLAGQKKLQELLKELTEEQKALEEMVQDKIDSDVNDMFDKESDRLEEEAEKAKDDLDEQFSDEKLQQIVKDALTSGVFVDIDGNIKDLQDTLLEFEDKFGEGMTAIGSIIKSELVTNLEIAKESMRDLHSILGELDLEKFANSNYSLDMNMMRMASPTPTSNSNSVNFNSPLIVVEGNVDSNVVEELKSISREIEENVVRNIVGAIR